MSTETDKATPRPIASEWSLELRNVLQSKLDEVEKKLTLLCAVADAARELETMTFRRENIMGDPCSLLEAKANLASAARKVKAALAALEAGA